MGDADKSLRQMFTDIVHGDGTSSSDLDRMIINQTPFVSKVKRELMEKGKGKILGGFGFPNEPYEF